MLDSLLGQIQMLPFDIIQVIALHQFLDIQFNRRQRIPDLMGYTGRNAADGSQLFCLNQLLIGRLLLFSRLKKLTAHLVEASG